MEFVITSGSARSADVDVDFSFGADKTAATLTTISISVIDGVFLCIMSSSKQRTSATSLGAAWLLQTLSRHGPKSDIDSVYLNIECAAR